jgi:hypothetical protein
MERAISFVVVGGQVRLAAAHQIEQDRPVPGFKMGGHQSPHILIAAKTVSKHHCCRAGPERVIVTLLRCFTLIGALTWKCGDATLFHSTWMPEVDSMRSGAIGCSAIVR